MIARDGSAHVFIVVENVGDSTYMLGVHDTVAGAAEELKENGYGFKTVPPEGHNDMGYYRETDGEWWSAHVEDWRVRA